MEARMHDWSFVMQRIAAGDRVYFTCDFYGKVWITVSRGRIFKRKTRVSLPPGEVARIKDALHTRHKGLAAAA
jgi:hypothetical protein